MSYIEKVITTELEERLSSNEAYFTDKGHEAPKDYLWYQADDIGDGEKDVHPYDRPAIKFEFGEIELDTERVRGSMRNATVPVTLHVERIIMSDGRKGSEDQDDFRRLLEYHWLVNELVEGWRLTCGGPFHLVSVSSDHNADNRMIHRLNYRVTVKVARPSGVPG